MESRILFILVEETDSGCCVPGPLRDLVGDVGVFAIAEKRC